MKNKKLPAIHFSDRAQSVLVTGATGFIGQRLVRTLLADGQRVTILSRDPGRAARMFDGQAKCIGSMSELAPEYVVGTIINLAGARILGPYWTAARKAVLRNSRIGVTDSLVAWIGEAVQRPKLLLSASAVGYYGIQPLADDRALTEDSPPQEIFMSQLCRDWEQAAQQATALGVRVVRMRFGVVLGEQGALPMMMLPIRLGLGGPLGSGRQWLSWIHIDDVLRGMAHLWHAHGEGVFNFTAPETVRQRQFARIAAQVVHRPSFFPTPGLPMRLALGEQADLLLQGQRVAPARLQASGFSFAYPDLRSALESVL